MRLVTADVPAVGGGLKAIPEDFVVEELPAYEPSGAGEHRYVWVEKKGLDTAQVAKALARAAGVNERDVGYAGMKDRQAVTRQYLSVPMKSDAELPEDLGLPGVRVLRVSRHGNKLRNGHLRGNRFTLRLRDVAAAEHLDAKLAALRARGLPNFFGAQRFGMRDDNAGLGKKLLLGERLPGRVSGFQRKLYLSAYQSLLFNRLLDARLDDGTFARALLGDVLRKEETGGSFVCADPDVDQPRVESFEVSPTGPIYGPRMTEPSGDVALREAALLAEEGLTMEHFRGQRGEAEGTRRAFRIPVPDCAGQVDGSDVVLSFSLPKGSYATVFLAELQGTGASSASQQL